MSYAEEVLEPKTDAHLIQIVDLALADVAVRSGEHLLCRPGCAQCCVGAFAIHALDVERLLGGYDELRELDPARFQRIRQRVEAYVGRTSTNYPGDAGTGALDDSEEGQERFEEFANDEVCPVLDPETSTCDLYEARPMTCRVFGPPVRIVCEDDGPASQGVESGLGVCELCFVEATPVEIAACELIADPENLEQVLLDARLENGAMAARTTVSYALSTYLERRNRPEKKSQEA